MCLIWVSGMYNMPWVCFHMHVGVFLSRFQREGARPKKPFGTSDGNDRNWKQIRGSPGPSGSFKASRRRNGHFYVDAEPAVLQQRGVIDLFVQYHSAWCCVRNFSVSSSVWILPSLERRFIAAEIWIWSILWHEEKGSLPLNGPGGDWKMAFICNTPHSDSKYSIFSTKKEKNHGTALFTSLKEW